MILDEGCAERGCPMHDSRETKGVVFIRKEWVGLTESEIEAALQQWDYEVSRGGGLKKLVAITEALLKEKNI